MYLACLLFTICAEFVTQINSGRIGEVHTSAAQISELVQLETHIVSKLKTYLQKEERRLKIIRRYVADWQSFDSSKIVSNPLDGYHFLQRVSIDFQDVQNSLAEENSLKVLSYINKTRSDLTVAHETDVNGAAWALVRLQDVYNLTIDDLLQGNVYGSKASKGLTAMDCFRFSDQSFQNLEFDLSEKWTQTGISVMESKNNYSSEDEDIVTKMKTLLLKRKIMKGLVTKLVQKSSDEVIDRFSGLGIPVSFQKVIHAMEDDASEQLSAIENSFRSLCRGEVLQDEQIYKDLSCYYARGDKSLYRLIMPFKMEILWPSPLMVLYHDVVSEKETTVLKSLAFPKLNTTQVHSFTSHIPMKSLARIGKTAWVVRGEDPLVDKILKRTEHMTGLSTVSAEDFHILNYGIGGHYDVHVDFFDLREKNLDLNTHLGDRVATVLFYMNDAEAGGATVFPSLNIRVPTERGSALLWFNLKRNGKGDYRTVHASCPVLLGQKWIANLWLHEYGQEFRWRCTLDPEE